jgi:hypothetical protein
MLFMDPEKMLLKIDTEEGLSQEDLSEVIGFLDSVDFEDCEGSSLDTVYSCLVVIGRANAKQCLPILERFLDFKDALTLSKLVEILGLDWGMADHLLQHLIRFTVGVSWDYEEDLRQSSIKVLGEYLNDSIGAKPAKQQIDARSSSVIELLLKIFEDDEQDEWTRKSAYLALGRASGKSWEELPAECAFLDLSSSSKDIDSAVIDFCTSSLTGSLAEVLH